MATDGDVRFTIRGRLVDDLQGPPLREQGSTLRYAQVAKLVDRLGSDWINDHELATDVWTISHRGGLWFQLDGASTEQVPDEAIGPMANALLDAVEDHVKGGVLLLLDVTCEEGRVVGYKARVEPMPPAPRTIEEFARARGRWARLPRG